MKKKLIEILILIVVLLATLFVAFRPGGPLGDRVSSDSPIYKIFSKLNELILRQQPAEGEVSGEPVIIYFKNGNTMIAELLEKTENRYLVKWKGQETIVYAEQVKRIGTEEEILKEKKILTDEEITKWWPYKNDIVIRLTNRIVADARIIRVGEDKLTLLYPVEGAGRIEQDIERARVEYLIFKPIDNRESKQIEETLKELFPQMQFYKEGNFTVITDSHISWVQEYKKTLREVYTNIYFEFFDLFKDRKPKLQNFLVIFDDYLDFIEYAITDGVPGWVVAGYFSPEQKTLYLFNVLGDKFSEILFEAMVGISGRTIDDIVDRVEGQVDERYHIFVEGEAKRIKDKFWNAYGYYKGMYREATMSTLRHEFTHAVFHNWGLQNIVLSKFEGDKEKIIKQKKAILQAKDYQKKAELLQGLVSLKRTEILDMQAANSWLVEGLATYCEKDFPGSHNSTWLFYYQQMEREGSIYPLASLTFHTMGSFPGACPKSMLHLYAQSWALVSFLMEKYPQEFMQYQNKMAEDTAIEHQDLEWLLQAMNKDLRTLEQEFVEYMSAYEEVEDPEVSSFVRLHDIFSD